MTLIAQELHDGVAQDLWFANVQVRMLRTVLRSGTAEEATEIVDLLQSTLERGHQEVRSLLKGAYCATPECELAGFRSFAEDLTRAGGPHLTLAADIDEAALDHSVLHQLVRIAREAVTNAWKHGRARNVWVILVVTGRLSRVKVADDGCGFDVLQPRSADRFGLTSMKDRAAAIGGTLELRSAPGKGTTVEVVATHRARDSERGRIAS